MKRLEQLPSIAQKQLGGLEADMTLLCKIRIEAAEKKQKPARAAVLRPVLAVCAALVICVGAVMSMDLGGQDTQTPVTTAQVLDSHSAGDVPAPAAMVRTAEVPKGSITMSAGMKRQAGSLFSQSESASFPLITLQGATYRMLEEPEVLPADLLGADMGAVSEFNVEPALGSGGVVSNVVACGETVYAVQDLGGALVAANVDGVLRAFQRVSYAGGAVMGAETLADTLCASDDVAWIELEGVGRAEGEQAQELMATLLDCADYQNTAFSGSTSMQIGLSCGLTLQLMTAEDSVSACGTWSCPDFFEAFASAVQ